MCPVCGTLLQLAESPQAQREKAFIDAPDRRRQERRRRSRTRWSPSTATRCWRCRSGSGFSLSAYLVPIIAFLVAAVALASGCCAGAARAGRGGGSRPEPPGPSGEDAERLDADLARYDL